MVAARSFPRLRQGGFTYVGLVVLVTIVGLVGAATLKADALLRRAAAERELLEIGAAFSDALASYAQATPPGQPAQPPSLEALLRDPRFPGVRRHLRKIFVDPVTGKAAWGIVWMNRGAGADGSGGSGVLAVYSLSEAKPLKQANFDARFRNLENREHISEWKFAALGQGVAQGQPGQPSQPSSPPPQAPAEPKAPGEAPSLFPGRGKPDAMKPSPAEAPPPGEDGSAGKDAAQAADDGQPPATPDDAEKAETGDPEARAAERR